MKRTPHKQTHNMENIIFLHRCDCMIFPFCLYEFPVRALRQENSVSDEHVRFCVAIAYGLPLLLFYSYLLFARLNNGRNNAHIINYKHLSHVIYWTQTDTLFFSLLFCAVSFLAVANGESFYESMAGHGLKLLHIGHNNTWRWIIWIGRQSQYHAIWCAVGVRVLSTGLMISDVTSVCIIWWALFFIFTLWIN